MNSKQHKTILDDLFFSKDIILNKNTPTKEEYKNRSRNSDTLRDKLRYKTIYGDSKYTWVDSKGVKIEKAPVSSDEVELRSKALGKNFSGVNTNKQTWNEDFPGMFGMNAPTAADGPGLATGNGKGGEIFPRPQIKWSSENTNNAYKHESGLPIVRRSGGVDEILSLIGRVGGSYAKYTPWGSAYMAANRPGSRIKAITQGALKNALAGGIVGAGINYFRSGKPETMEVEVYNPRTGNMEIKEVTVPTDKVKTPLWKDMLIGGLVGGGIGGLIGNTGHFDYKYRNKFSSFGPSQDILAILNSKIMSDTAMDFTQKKELMTYIQSLPSQTITQFVPLLGQLLGAGAGALIAKKLLGLGFTGSILSALAGGILGGNLFKSLMVQPKPEFNPIQGLGFVSNTGKLI